MMTEMEIMEVENLVRDLNAWFDQKHSNSEENLNTPVLSSWNLYLDTENEEFFESETGSEELFASNDTTINKENMELQFLFLDRQTNTLTSEEYLQMLNDLETQLNQTTVHTQKTSTDELLNQLLKELAELEK